MSFFSSFVLSFGAMLVLMVLMAVWLFRTSAAAFSFKIAVPTLLIALACYAPLCVNDMMGYPVTVSLDQLPDRAELVAFVAHDGDKEVDLWLRAGDVPRAYETTLDAEMKSTLREAQEELAHGRGAILIKRGIKNGAGQSSARDAPGIGDDPNIYILDPNNRGLPPKE